jgi:hypothetical protein
MSAWSFILTHDRYCYLWKVYIWNVSHKTAIKRT